MRKQRSGQEGNTSTDAAGHACSQAGPLGTTTPFPPFGAEQPRRLHSVSHSHGHSAYFVARESPSSLLCVMSGSEAVHSDLRVASRPSVDDSLCAACCVLCAASRAAVPALSLSRSLVRQNDSPLNFNCQNHEAWAGRLSGNELLRRLTDTDLIPKPQRRRNVLNEASRCDCARCGTGLAAHPSRPHHIHPSSTLRSFPQKVSLC